MHDLSTWDKWSSTCGCKCGDFTNTLGFASRTKLPLGLFVFEWRRGWPDIIYSNWTSNRGTTRCRLDSLFFYLHGLCPSSHKTEIRLHRRRCIIHSSSRWNSILLSSKLSSYDCSCKYNKPCLFIINFLEFLFNFEMTEILFSLSSKKKKLDSARLVFSWRRILSRWEECFYHEEDARFA